MYVAAERLVFDTLWAQFGHSETSTAGPNHRDEEASVRKHFLATFLALSTVGPVQAQEEHGRFDFTLAIAGQEHILTYDGTHEVMRDADPRVKLVVFVHHGGSQNPTTYFDRLVAALDAADRDRPAANLKATTLVVSPAMIGEHHIADQPERYARGHYPFWDGGWREGANSLNAPAVSNYDLLDGMVRHVVDSYPGVKAVVHVGHSAGGQLVSRYSVGTPVYDELRSRGIFVRYIAANPSSMLYFDHRRPDLVAGEGLVNYRGRAPFVAGGDCLGFNRYKYGLDGRVPYMTRRPAAALLASFRERELFLFQGLEDNDPTGDGVDRDCSALLQGRHRLERGKRYYEYLGHFFGPEIYETKFIEFAPGVGHHSGEMFLSETGRAIIFIDADSAAASIDQSQMEQETRRFALAIHGGCCLRSREGLEANPAREQAYRNALTESLSAGYAVLRAGASAVEAVEAAIMVMEDSPLFNAGKGASYTRDGTVELDATIMNGKTMRAGGVGAVRRIRNPIGLARLVMEETPHVLVVGEGAGALAQEMGVPWVPESYFYTERKWNELLERLELQVPYGTSIPRSGRSPAPDEPADAGLWGTVGAVAIDADGNLAAGTSTGGRITKRPGRVGDSPIIGASTYANNETVAVSTTGLGERHMVLLTAKEISSLVRYRGMSVEEAAENTIKVQLVALGGGGGAIAMDNEGNIAMPFTGAGFYRGWVREDGRTEVRIYDQSATGDPAAYAEFLRLLAAPSEAGSEEAMLRRRVAALEGLQSRLESYAPAATALGTAYLDLAGLVGGRGPYYEKATHALAHAFELDPGYPPARAKLASLFAKLGRSEEAAELLVDGLVTYPDYPAFHETLGYVLRYAGLMEESMASYRRGQELDSSLNNLVSTQDQITKSLIYLGDYDAALGSHERMMSFLEELGRPPNEKQRFYEGVIHLYRGDPASAIRAFRAGAHLEPESVWTTFGRGYEAMALEDTARVEAVLEELESREVVDGERHYRLVHFAAFAGHPDRALDHLQKATDGGFFNSPYLESDPWLESLRSSPRFRDLVSAARARHDAVRRRLGGEVR